MRSATRRNGPGRCASYLCAALGGLALLLAARALPAQEAAAGSKSVCVLDGSGVWRVLYSWDRPQIKTESGLKPRVLKRGRYVGGTELPSFQFLTQYPAAGWTGVDFDDSRWARRHFFAKWANGEWDHRAGGGQGSRDLRQISMRGKFTVTDPAAAGNLRLTLAYRGGAAVYVNGTEIARANLPAGEIEGGALAEIYPDKAYLKDKDKPWSWWGDRDVVAKEAYPLRVRRLEGVAVPTRLLRKGTNVLSVEIHAAPYPEAFGPRKLRPEWSTCGLIELHLQAGGAGAVVPNVVRPTGVQVWNTNTAEELHDATWGDPHEKLRPVRMAGPRNGCASGRVVVSSDAAMTNVRAKVGPLATADGKKLPASAVKAWYGRFEPPCGSRWGGSLDYGVVQWGPLPWRRDDALIDAPPETVGLAAKPVSKALADARQAAALPAKLRDGAMQPVWVVAEIPHDAAPGDYRGTLTITLDGHDPIEVPVELKVIDWRLSDPAAYAYFMGMIQCPEGPALAYDVPMWSDRHCKLVARSLEWVAKLGPKVLYLPLTAESQYGNERSLVVWAKDAAGKTTHDFGAVEKYVDLAVKHMGKPQFVVLGVWDSCMHISTRGHRRKFPRYTVRDAQTGKLSNADGPTHGTDEAETFWKPVLHGVRDILAKRGLRDAMLMGYVADQQPKPPTVGVFHRILPKVGWQGTRHPPVRHNTMPYKGGTVPIKYQANVWGGWDNWDPAERRPYGWKYPISEGLRTWLDRGLFDASPIVQFRTACEQSLLAHRRGLGQIGVDFWQIKGTKTVRGGTLVGRYPATSEGNLGIYSGQLLYPGPNGAVPTVRYQMMRENIQACEARIFLERLLLEEPCRLDGRLAAKCRDLLDERTRWHRMQGVAPAAYLSWPYSGWEARLAKLYHAAAEAAHALAKK